MTLIYYRVGMNKPELTLRNSVDKECIRVLMVHPPPHTHTQWFLTHVWCIRNDHATVFSDQPQGSDHTWTSQHPNTDPSVAQKCFAP